MLDLAVPIDPQSYCFEKDQELLTPALVIYPEMVRHNIDRMIAVLGGDPNRWRPHLKTTKLGVVMRWMVEAGIKTAKCATTLELLTACQSGFADVLVAYPHTGRNAQRVVTLARQFPGVQVSAIVESKEQIRDWVDSPVDLFIDINTGMDRTGLDGKDPESIVALAQEIQATGVKFRGLHFYDGNSTENDLAERTRLAHARYDRLLGLVAALKTAAIPVKTVITSGTPALPCAISHKGLFGASFIHQVSPGTVIYNDASSLKQLPVEYRLKPAALVISRVVSHPKPGVVTCDAGHKSVSVDSGVPNCLTLGRSDLTPLKPSEEHLPFAAADGDLVPALGETLYLIPRHVCPTVNNFDQAVLVEHNQFVSIERVTARGHEDPVSSGRRSG